MLPTAFVSHPDCARHDTGWKHPDHQGRLPALVRAVHRDMIALHEHLLEVEGVPAGESELRRVHSSDHLERIRSASLEAERAGRTQRLDGEVYVSGASWDAARAAAGTAVTGVRVVLDGRARNAFSAARPPGAAAAAGGVGGFSLVNNAAVAASHLRANGVASVLVVEWSGVPDSAIAGVLGEDPGVRVLSIGPSRSVAAEASAERSWSIGLPPGSGGELFRSVFEGALDDLLATWTPEFCLLSTGFDILEGDPVGRLTIRPAEIHALTRSLVERVEYACGGRLTSILDGGYDASALGAAAVMHLRALIGLEPA
jgi:acetoin utilization deacetylase AcuC-like enzyme